MVAPMRARTSRRPQRRLHPHGPLAAPRVVRALIYALTTANRLISVDSSAPATLLSDLPLTGLPNNQTVEGFDFSPSFGDLYLLTRYTNGPGGDLLFLNPQTGAL